MLRHIKLKLHASPSRDPGGKLADAEKKIAHLSHWFLKLEAALADNERLRSDLLFNYARVGTLARHVCHDHHPLLPALDHLAYRSGPCPHTHPTTSRTTTTISPPHRKGHQEIMLLEISAFNEQLRSLQNLSTACVSTVKREAYYADKLDRFALLGTKKKLITERDLQRRVRNERKLADAAAELKFLTDKLSRDLDMTLQRKDHVLSIVMQSFVQENEAFYSQNPIAGVLGCTPPKPTYINERATSYTFGTGAFAPSAPPEPLHPYFHYDVA